VRLALLGLILALAVPAGASAHHSLLIREVRPSPGPAPDLAFIELQTYADGQNGIQGAAINTYSATGVLTHTYNLPGDVPSPQAQRTALIGANGLAGTADYIDPGLAGAMSPAGGAVCFPESSPPDCVSWGTFTGGLPFPGAGTPAPAVPDGSSLHRTIARGCPTSLDQEDDSDVSAADFSLAAPSPRPNSVAPTELECVSCRGRQATVAGTEGADKLKGTSRADVIVALSGADTVKGLGGKDLLCGGRGKDRLAGGAGSDELNGQKGHDTCNGGGGKDSGRSCEVRKSV
jgi:hypothetical protein